jgi:hypothetical protein
MTFWMTRTPAFQLTTVLLSSPITLLVALWGMTSRAMMQQMRICLAEKKSSKQAQNLLPAITAPR